MEVVGRGGHSLVYRGVERSSDEQVAVKILHEDLPGRTEFETRMEREHAALVALEGTAALAPRSLFREEGRLCLATEFLRGQDLDEYLADVEAQGHRVEAATVVEFLGPITATLSRAHQNGILHRDLKPGNIYVLGRGGPGGVRLLDFGLSRLRSAEPITRDGMLIGSPSYIAPEVWDGKPAELDERMDVYSMGAIVYRMLAGRVPFPVGTFREKLSAAKSAERPSLRAIRADLPPVVDGWIKRVLAADRHERFESVELMWDEFLAVVDSGKRR